MNYSEVAGFPCPKCKDPHDARKRIKTSFAMLLGGRKASCTFCGLQLSMVMDAKGQKVVELASKLNNELSIVK